MITFLIIVTIAVLALGAPGLIAGFVIAAFISGGCLAGFAALTLCAFVAAALRPNARA
jgi:hypothetical protein